MGDAQVLVDGGREDVGVLGGHRDVVGELVALRSPRGHAVDKSRSRLGRHHARERRQQRGLPDAGGAHDGHRGAGTQRERNAAGQRRTTRPADGQVACLDDGVSFGNVVRLRGCFILEKGTDAGRSLGASHQLCSGGGQLGDSLERRQWDKDDDGEEYLSESARCGLWNADQQSADDGCAHRAHVEASSQRRQTRRAGQTGGQVALGASERVLRVVESTRQ